MGEPEQQSTPARRQADELRERDRANWEQYAYLKELTCEELVWHMQHRGPPREMGVPIEMSRRVIVSNAKLRQAIELFRASADKSSKRLERLTRWLIACTVVLIILTGVLVYLTVLIAHHA